MKIGKILFLCLVMWCIHFVEGAIKVSSDVQNLAMALRRLTTRDLGDIGRENLAAINKQYDHEQERIELEKQKKLGILEFERQSKLEKIEKEKIELGKKQERERIELERKMEQERIKLEKELALEKITSEKKRELAEKQKLKEEQERIALEQKLERERLEREKQEKDEQQKLREEQEILRIELERIEKEKLQKLELERKQKLKEEQERIEKEKLKEEYRQELHKQNQDYLNCDREWKKGKEKLKEKFEQYAKNSTGQPFATHMLMIIAEDEKSNTAMMDAVNGALKSNILFLVTEMTLFATCNENLPKTHRYFKIPSNTGAPRFVLCMPKDFVPEKIKLINDEEIKKGLNTYVPKITTEIEQKCGLLVEHFEEITEKLISEKTYKLEAYPEIKDSEINHEKMGWQLLSILRVIFVPNVSYQNAQDRPRWLLLFGGHGSQYKPYSDDEIRNLNDHPFIKKPGSMCGIDAQNFAIAIFELSVKINIALLFIITCYGGGINLGYLLLDVEKGIVIPYSFIVMTLTVTGNYTVSAIFELKKFFNIFKSIRVEKLDEKTMLPRYLPTHYSQPRTYMTTTFAPIYEMLPLAFSYVSGPFSLAAGMKPIATNYFIEVGIAGRAPIERIDATTEGKIVPAGSAFEPAQGSQLLLYINTIPFTIKLPLYATIYSALPGSTYHIIERLEALKIPELIHLRSTFLDLENVGPNITQLFRIKKWISRYEGEYSVWITREKGVFTCIVRSEKNGIPVFSLMNWFEGKPYTDTEKELSPEEAERQIKQFDEKVVFLKKLANAQAPYRFLKNAKIETEPWDV